MKTVLALSVLFLFLPLSAHATLGESKSSISRDIQKLKATQRVVAKAADRSGRSVYEMTVPGATVKEHVSSNGTVFAITWSGYHVPDLSVLLGSYYSDFQKARAHRQKVHGHQPLSISTNGVTVIMGGHMRELFGKAYVPALVPQNVDVNGL